MRALSFDLFLSMNRLWVGMIAVAMLMMPACTKPASDEDQIRHLLEEGVALLEKGDSASAADLLSDSYLDGHKRTKKTMKRIAFFVLRQGPIHVALRDVKIVVSADHATATFAAMALQGNASIETLTDVLPTGARRLDMTVRFFKEDGTWRVIAIEGDGMRLPV